MSDRRLSPKFIRRCLTDCLYCVGMKSASEHVASTNHIDKIKTEGLMFRPRRQTENNSSNSRPSESSNGGGGVAKSSPISLSAVTLRKTSKVNGPTSPTRKSPPQSKVSTPLVKLPTLLPTNLLPLSNNKETILEFHDGEDKDRSMRILYLRGLKGSTSEDRLSFRTVMEPMPKSSLHSRTFTSPDSEFMSLGLNKSRIKRNISKSTSTLQNSVAL